MWVSFIKNINSWWNLMYSMWTAYTFMFVYGLFKYLNSDITITMCSSKIVLGAEDIPELLLRKYYMLTFCTEVMHQRTIHKKRKPQKRLLHHMSSRWSCRSGQQRLMHEGPAVCRTSAKILLQRWREHAAYLVGGECCPVNHTWKWRDLSQVSWTGYGPVNDNTLRAWEILRNKTKKQSP